MHAFCRNPHVLPKPAHFGVSEVSVPAAAGQALACSAVSMKLVGRKGPVCYVHVSHGHLSGSAGHVPGSEQPQAAAGSKRLVQEHG